jgi:hypothetical protein
MVPDVVTVTRLALIAAVMLVGVGCSRTDLAYRNADWLLERYASRTVDSTPDQLEAWQPVLQDTLRRHREQELPLVMAYLELAERVVAATDEPAGAECLVEGALLLYRRHARLAVDLAVPVLTNLDAAQIRHLAEYTTRRQQDAVERYLNPDPQRRKAARQQRMTERIEKWTGRLDASGSRSKMRWSASPI